ncbi:MAG: class I SAM-dependent methyltransferase [Oscillospiraceae bacterium]|nr:class I SAM-dependent methyltransferase [Oscillospiraceae bacterium]
MNEQRFTGKVELYRKYRPSYPKEFVDYLYTQIGFTHMSTIADIGAGTGIFSRLLLERGSKVYAVEPNDDMRAVAIDDLSEHNNFFPVAATAEYTGLNDKSVDYITVAEAFHYFDKKRFKLECQRILKSGGSLVITWNSVDRNSPLIQKSSVIIEKYRIDDKSAYRQSGSQNDFSDLFLNGNYGYMTFKNYLYEDRERFIGGNLSAGYAPIEKTYPKEYDGFVKELNTLFDKYSNDGIIRFPFITKSHVGVVDYN